MTTKDEIRAALDREECEHEKQWWREHEFTGHCRDCDADVIAALLPEETKTVEYRVVWPDGKAFGGYTESDWEADQDSDHDYRWQRHTIGTTPWEDA